MKTYTKEKYFDLLLKREKAEAKLLKASKTANVFNKGLWIVPPVIFGVAAAIILYVFLSFTHPTASLLLGLSAIPMASYIIGYIPRCAVQRTIAKIDKRIGKAEMSLGIDKQAELSALNAQQYSSSSIWH